MKKISILSLHLGYGGIEKSIVALANTLCTKYDVEIATCYNLYGKCVFDLDKRVKVKYLNGNLKPNHDSLRQAIKSKNIINIIKEGIFSLKVLYHRRKSMINYIKNKKCDVMISTRDIFNYWLSDYGNEKILKIGWEHNHFHENYKYANNISKSAKKLDYLVLVSSELQKFYANELRNSNCMCIYIPNSIESLPKRIAPLDNKKFISIGRLSPEKGQLDLLKIFNRISRDYPDWSLDIIGDGAERSNLEEYISKHDLSDKVILHGFQGKDYIDKMLHDSSIYLMTSFTESFGIVLIEAMSHGVPCVAFDSAEGAREIITSGENGFLIKNRSMDAMIMKLESLMDKKEERIKIGKQARDSVKKYTSDVVGEEWFSLIEESGVYE
jgi:N-acetylglucosaminyldiphosphoundecaprenol N-acetyl-beta-D-mannosaminyltransferase